MPEMSKLAELAPENLIKRLAAYAFAALCLMVWSFGAQAAKTKAEEIVRPVSGSYLAGRFAGRMRDNDAAVRFFIQTLRRDPNNRIVLERTMLLVAATGDVRRAVRLARRIAKYNPDHRSSRLFLGLAELRAGRYGSARRYLSKPGNVPLSRLTSAVLTAWSHVAQNNLKAALGALDALKSIDSMKRFYLFHKALILDVGGRRTRAGKAYEEAYRHNKTSLRTVQAYGRFLERSKKNVAARGIYRDFLVSRPTHPLIRVAAKRARARRRPNRLVPGAMSGAAELLFGVASILSDDAGIDLPLRFARLAVFMRPKFTLAQVLVGDIYGDTQRYRQAVRQYARVSSASPLKRNADIQSAASLDRLKKYAEARKILNRVIKSYPTDFKPVMVLADMLRSRSKFSEATEYYSRAIKLVGELKKNHWQLLYHRGISFERTKEWPRAEKDFKKALVLMPDQPLVMNYLGYSWVEKKLNLNEAMAMIRKAVKLRSRDGFIVDSLGWAHYRLGQYGKAVTALERAVQLRPADPILNDHLGDAYWRVDRKLEARFQWAHARDLKPEPDALEKIKGKLKNGLDETDKSGAGKAKPNTD